MCLFLDAQNPQSHVKLTSQNPPSKKNPCTNTFQSFRVELAVLVRWALRAVQEQQNTHPEALPNRALRWGCLSSPPQTAPQLVTCSTQKSHVVLLSASFTFSLLISNGYSQKQGASKTQFTETSTQRQLFVWFCFVFKLCTLSDSETSVMLFWPLCTAPPQLKEGSMKGMIFAI